jgi:hypothetical protein
MILEKFTCIIPDFPREIQVSKKRNPVYWKVGDKLPKKYAKLGNSNGFIVDAQGNKLVKNVKTVGTPKSVPINSQLIYVGLHHSVRGKIVDAIHTLFHDEFKKQLPAKIDLKEDQRILISLNFHDVLSRKTRDLDNLSSLFFKCGIDCLTTPSNPNQVTSSGYSHKLGIIEDDSIYFIPYIAIEFTPIPEGIQRHLDFNVYVVSKDFSVECHLDALLNITNRRNLFNVQFNPFCKGDTVTCRRADFGLTLNKQYTVTDRNENAIEVVNDQGKPYSHPFRIFIKGPALIDACNPDGQTERTPTHEY